MDFLKTITLARSGDTNAVDELFSRYYPRVQSIVHRALAQDLRVKRPWLTAMFSTGDVVQDVFRGVLRNLSDFQGPNEASFVAFLATLVKNRIVDAVRFHEALRRDPRRNEASGDINDHMDSSRSNPAELAQLNDEVEQVASALNSFPSRERLLLQERLESGTTFSQLANQLGYPSEDAARKAFYATQARLLIRLRASGIGGDA